MTKTALGKLKKRKYIDSLHKRLVYCNCNVIRH